MYVRTYVLQYMYKLLHTATRLLQHLSTSACLLSTTAPSPLPYLLLVVAHPHLLQAVLQLFEVKLSLQPRTGGLRFGQLIHSIEGS